MQCSLTPGYTHTFRVQNGFNSLSPGLRGIKYTSVIPRFTLAVESNSLFGAVGGQFVGNLEARNSDSLSSLRMSAS